VPAHSSFNTKKSALVTLRKIRKRIAPSGDDAVGSEVRNNLVQDDSMEKAMFEIVGGMSDSDSET